MNQLNALSNRVEYYDHGWSIEPKFDTLPWKEEYDAANETSGQQKQRGPAS
jgi:hypothetical protein